MSLLNVFIRICLWVVLEFFSLVIIAEVFTYLSIIPAIIIALLVFAFDLLALVKLLKIY